MTLPAGRRRRPLSSHDPHGLRDPDAPELPSGALVVRELLGVELPPDRTWFRATYVTPRSVEQGVDGIYDVVGLIGARNLLVQAARGEITELKLEQL